MKNAIITILIILIILSNISPDTIHAIGEYRNPLTLVTWTVGTVLDEAGNGKECAPFTDSYYNYIAYDKDKTKPGQKVFTVLVYNPTNLYYDDIILRFDF